jgi:hypothetical protein
LNSRPEPEEPPVGPVNTQRVGAFSWRPFAVIAVVLAVIGLALWKPWESPKPALLVARALPTATPEPTPTPTPKPTIDPVIDAASSRMLCNAPPAWRLITMETDVLGYSRTMFGLAPGTASGPTDPTIPTVDLNATWLFGLGACRPNPAGLRIPDLPLNPITIWQISPTGSATQVDNTFVIDGPLSRLGEVYLGPPAADATAPPQSGTEPSWRAGRYVVEISAANSQDQPLWFALDFTSIQKVAGVLGQ